MSEPGRSDNAVVLASFAAAAVILGVRLAGFGIWDPWELNAADEARRWMQGTLTSPERSPLATWLIGSGFRLFGVREWAGRLPLVIASVAMLAAIFAVAKRFDGARTGAYAVAVAASTPLVVFNARQMLGEAPAMLGQALVGWTTAVALLVVTTPDGTRMSARSRFAWAAAMLLAVAFAVIAGGALRAALPPLAAAVAVAAIDGAFRRNTEDRSRALVAWVAALSAVALTIATGIAVARDAADFSFLIGGRPQGEQPPTFDRAIDDIFHAFAPWSAVLPIALGTLMAGGATHGDDASTNRSAPVRGFIVVWAAFAYGAHTLFTSRYGASAFIAAPALALAIALFLRDTARTSRSNWTAAVIAALMAGLVIRDFALYPGSPIDAFGVADIQVPAVFNPKVGWAAAVGLFAVGAALSLGPAPTRSPTAWRAPWELVVTQWRRGGGIRAWLVLTGAAMAFMLVFGAICLACFSVPFLTTLVINVGRALFFVPLAIVVAVYAAMAALHLASRLGEYRMVPALVGGLAVGGYASLGFTPALSAHFSPREVYDTFNALASSGEALAEFRVGGRAAAYYARGQVREVRTQQELLQHLNSDQRRWAVFPADELPAINRAYRAATGKHLFVADARSARVLLATNDAIAGRPNQNFIADAVLASEPNVQHRVGARFEDKIELIGFDLDLPHGEHVGAGESFTVTWYWRALSAVPGGYKIFLHVDGQGLRLNGDHEPVDDRYPVRLWERGDIVKDVQRLTVPANYRPGDYTFFIGFYSGESRLRVESGPKDDANRVNAGTLRIR